MKLRNPTQLVNILRSKMKSERIKQQYIAKKCNIDQSVISKYLKKPPKKVTPVLIKICNYANIDLSSDETPDVDENTILIGALEKIWDGTDEHAKKIAKVISALN